MGNLRTVETEIVQNLEQLRTSIEQLRTGFAVQETKLDSVNKLAEKSQADIREIKDSLQATNSNLALLNKDLKEIADDCHQLNKTVIVGNGVPPLKESIAVLQNWRADTTKTMGSIEESLEEFRQDFGAYKDQNNREAKEDGKEVKKSKTELTIQTIGWVVVILAVGLEVLLNKVFK